VVQACPPQRKISAFRVLAVTKIDSNADSNLCGQGRTLTVRHEPLSCLNSDIYSYIFGLQNQGSRVRILPPLPTFRAQERPDLTIKVVPFAIFTAAR